MLWVIGIGLILIGIALLIGAIALIKPLNNFAKTLKNVEKTTKNLPKDVQEMTAHAKSALGGGVDTIHQVNKQIKELSPIFHMIGDAGRATNRFSSKIVSATDDLKNKTDVSSNFMQKKNLEGLYGLLTLGYFLFQRARKK